MSGTAIVLFNYGGPDSLDAVEPYLRNIFRDPDLIPLPLPLRPLRPLLARFVAWRRAPYARSQYAQIGGRSPLNELTERQARALERALAPHGAFRVLLAMRYFEPLTARAVEAIAREGLDRALLLPLYPQYSRTTTGSSVNEFERERRRAGLEGLAVRVVRSYHDHPGYVAAVAESIEETLASIPASERDDAALLFSAHGLPAKVVERGDPYQREVEATARLVAERLGGRGYEVCYQSKVGPMRWLEPTIAQALAGAARRGARRAVVYPISFVSDHSETLYELDILYRKQAEGLGLAMHRVPALNDGARFIEALRDIALAAWDGEGR